MSWFCRDEQQGIHFGVLEGIERLPDPNRRGERHRLWIDGSSDYGINRHSLQHLVHFLENRDSHEVTELELYYVVLRYHPSSDGGLNILQSFFSRSNTTLTNITLAHCTNGTTEEASQLLAAFQTNRTITSLTIQFIYNLEGSTTLGACLSGLLEHMPQLQRLKYSTFLLSIDAIRALQPGIRNNQTLKELDISCCRIGDEGIHFLANALVGNTTMEVLNIRLNHITSNGLDDVTQLIESTQLKTLEFSGNSIVNDGNMGAFLTILHKNTTIEKLGMLMGHVPTQSAATIICARNKGLTQADFLLTPLTMQHQEHHQHPTGTTTTTTTTTTTMWIKTCHKAIAKLAMVPNNAGASAIFKLFQARPALLEKRLKRPAAGAAAAAAAVAIATSQYCSTSNSSIEESSSSVTNSQPTKHQRL